MNNSKHRKVKAHNPPKDPGFCVFGPNQLEKGPIPKPNGISPEFMFILMTFQENVNLFLSSLYRSIKPNVIEEHLSRASGRC